MIGLFYFIFLALPPPPSKEPTDHPVMPIPKWSALSDTHWTGSVKAQEIGSCQRTLCIYES